MYTYTHTIAYYNVFRSTSMNENKHFFVTCPVKMVTGLFASLWSFIK